MSDLRNPEGELNSKIELVVVYEGTDLSITSAIISTETDGLMCSSWHEQETRHVPYSGLL